MKVLLEQVSEFKKSNVLKGTLLLSLSNAVSGTITILSIPIFSRLYTPEQLGYGAFFLALAMSILPLTTLRLEYAVVNEKNEEQLDTILIFAALLAIPVATLSTLLIVPFKNIIPLPNPLLFLATLPVFLIALSFVNMGTFLFTRQKKYQLIGKNQITQAAIRSILIITFVVISPNLGMALGYLCSSILMSLIIYYQIRTLNLLVLKKEINKSRLVGIYKKYKKLMLHSLSTNYINNIAGNLLPIVFAIYFSPSAVGIIFVTQQLIAFPAQLIAQAFWRTMFSELSNFGNEQMRAFAIKKIYRNAIPILLIPLAIVIILAESVTIILGAKWAEVTQIVPYCMLMVFINVLSNITSYFVSSSRYKHESMWNVIILAVRFGAIIGIPIFIDSMLESIKYYFMASAVVYYLLNFYWAVTLDFTRSFFLNNFFLVFPIIAISFYSYSHIDNIFTKVLTILIIVILLSVILAHRLLRHKNEVF